MKVTKKIALASAAALAIVGISTSAHAAPLAVTVAGSANTTVNTYAGSQAVAVPSSNVIDAGHSVALSATADTGTVVSFVASGVKLVVALDSVAAPKTVASGISSYSATSQGSAVTVYAYTTSTSVGSVTITNGAYSTVVYIHGTSGTIYNVSVSLPGAIATGTIGTVTASATDVFGNPVESASLAVTLVNGTFSDLSTTKTLVTSTKVAADADLTGATVWGSASYKLAAATGSSITAVVSTSASITPVLGLATPITTGAVSVSISDLNATISSLSAQLASLSAQLASANAALTAEKAAHAADVKSAADAKAIADVALAAEKAAHAADVKSAADAKTIADVALATEKATHVADSATATAKYKALLAKYNAKAKRYGFATTK